MGWTTVVRFPEGVGNCFSPPPPPHRLLGLTQPPNQWIPESLSTETKRPGREADHSPPFSAEVKVELYFHSPNTPLWCGAQLKKRVGILPYLNFQVFLVIKLHTTE